MARTVGIGHQDFEQIIQNNLFYIDKTGFIKEWWENGDAVTLITRPGRAALYMEDEKGLSDTVKEALRQIERQNYAVSLTAKGIPENRIRKYGFAFQGKKVLIGEIK